MKRHLYYFTWFTNKIILSTVLDDLQQSLNKGEQVLLITCDGGLKPCWVNNTSNEINCKKCSFNKNIAINNLKGSVTHLQLNAIINKDVYTANFKTKFKYESIEDIKNLIYKDVKIGYAALSSYISWTRNQDPVIDIDFKNYFDKLLIQQYYLTDVINKVFLEFDIERVSIFNGRTADVRPVFDTVIKKNIPLRGIENIVDDDVFCRKEIFYDALPQSINFHHKRIEKVWVDSTKTLDEKVALGKDFFLKRKSGALVRDRIAYTKNQNRELLPDKWNPQKRNIVIFNSSEDEVIAIPDFDALALFKSQEKAINFILENINDPDIHFYLRIHPNLSNVKYGYHSRLYDLEKRFKNITVIPSDSKISTYKVMDEAEKVIIFNSSTGAEASFWGKPVIMLSGQVFYHLDVCYIPKNQSDVLDLILSKLEPKNNKGALKYAYYLIDYHQYTEVIEKNPSKFVILGKVLGYTFPFLKIMDSSLLFKIYEKLKFNWFICVLFKKDKDIIPIKGN